MGGLSGLLAASTTLSNITVAVNTANINNQAMNEVAQGIQTRASNTTVADGYIAQSVESAMGQVDQMVKTGVKDENTGLETRSV